MTVRIIEADVMDGLAQLDDGSAQACVTSPPYWGLRDYGIEPVIWGDDKTCACQHTWGEKSYQRRSNDGGDPERKQETNAGAVGRDAPIQHAFCLRCNAWRGALGLEPTPELYVAHIVEVMREVKRVLRNDGTLWLNMGDSYFGDSPTRKKSSEAFSKSWDPAQTASRGGLRRSAARMNGLKPKDLIGMPWRVAFALQADGWWLRSDIIWAKPNPMPESVTDRPTRSHEYVFLLAKSARYYYDADAIREPHSPDGRAQTKAPLGDASHENYRGADGHERWPNAGRNKRSVWTIATQPYPGAHFASFPEKLVEPCILAGTSEWGCCSECRASWTRVVEKKPATMNIRVRDNAKGIIEQKSGIAGRYKASDAEIAAYGPEEMGESHTIGWRPTCKHAGEPVPATVLDPFAGSGTVGLVAQKAGRSAVLIDVNPDYCAMMRDRLRQLSLFGAPALNG